MEYIEREAIKYEQWPVGPLYEPIMVVRKKTIDNIPAADVAQVRHAKWELTGADKRGRGGNWECAGRDGCGKSYPYKCDFCPNCGAKMDLEG